MNACICVALQVLSATIFFVSHWPTAVQFRLDWLASKPQGSSCLLLACAGITSMSYHAQLFSMWILGFGPILLYLHGQYLTISPTSVIKKKKLWVVCDYVHVNMCMYVHMQVQMCENRGQRLILGAFLSCFPFEFMRRQGLSLNLSSLVWPEWLASKRQHLPVSPSPPPPQPNTRVTNTLRIGTQVLMITQGTLDQLSHLPSPMSFFCFLIWSSSV